MKQTQDALSKLANNAIFLTKNHFPNKENAEKCRRSLALIEDLTNRIIAEEENLSSSYLKLLKSNFLQYMHSQDFFIPKFLLNKRSIKQLIMHLADKEFYNFSISESDDEKSIKKVFLLLENATKQLNLSKDISICLLKFYYSFYKTCSKSFVTLLKIYLDKHFSEKYYLLQKDFVDLYTQYDNKEVDYVQFLKNIKINANFISTKFFQEMWSVWCMTRNSSTYSEAFFKNNKGLINSEKEDKRKCILAVITCKVNQIKAKEIIVNHLLPMFGSVNPAENSYWMVSSNTLNKSYKKYLEEAPKIYYKYFSKTFLESFFFVLSNADEFYEQQRSTFWLKYINEIEDFKIAVTEEKDKELRKNLSKLPGNNQLYMKFYENCKISIRKNNNPAALLMKIKNILAIEFTEYGNAVYLYKKDHAFSKDMFNKKHVERVSNFKKANVNFIGSIPHSGHWQASIDRELLKLN